VSRRQTIIIVVTSFVPIS